MKIVKELEHALLLNYFGLGGKYYLVVTVMTFFGFDNPDQVLKEQELWPFAQGELGKDAILDMAMPKPNAEVIIKGKCFAHKGKPVPANRVSFRMGAIRKSLDVFGNRYWELKGGVKVITDPKPFTVMDISYQNAFGGKNFPKNPSGKGIDPVITESGGKIFPLPNIEDPDHTIGSPADRPDPAGFAPYDFTWPQRSKKLGTYDDKWLQEHWPFYPADMDWTYFNAAPDNQQREGYFKGDEILALQNMHPEKPVIESRLPGLRQRCFVNQLKDLKSPDKETIFREVKINVDTVWLFPHAERGIVINRGMTEIADDEAKDVLQLYVATEGLSEKPKSIEHYLEEFHKRLDRKIPFDMAPMEEAKKKLAEAKKRIKELPREINDAMARGLGEAPRPHRTPAETIANSMALIEKQGKLLDDAETRVGALKAKYGHLVKIDMGRFAQTRQKLEEAKKRLTELSGKIEKTTAKVKDAQSQMKDKVKGATAKIDPAILKEKGFDPDKILEPFEPSPRKLWHQSGIRFAEECQKNLHQNPRAMSDLRALGLSPYTIKKAWLGINPEEQRHDPAPWGIKREADSKEETKDLLIGAGLIIPHFDKATLDRLTIRPGDFTDASEDSLVEESTDTVLVLGAGEGKPFVRVADELEALILHQEAGGFCAVAALKDPKAKPDKDTAKLMQDAPQFLVAMGGGEEIEAWKKVYPQAEPLFLPAGNNLFEARKSGTDLRNWIADALKPELTPEEEPEKAEDEGPGVAIPAFDIPAMMKKAKDTINARVQPKLDELEAKKKAGMDIVRKRLVEQGLDPDEVLKPPEKSILDEANPVAAAKEKYAKQFASVRERLQRSGHLTPEIESKLAEAEKANQELLQKSAGRYDAGMTKLAAAKKQKEAGKPEWAKKLLSRAGIDPDDPAPLKVLSREEVVERYKDGQSLAGKNLSGVDISNLDLHGIDLQRAMLQKANLSGSNLDDADLTRVLANEADFSKASLQGTNMERGLFQKTKFMEANLKGSNLTRAIMSEADMTEANLTEASLEKTLLEKARLIKARLVGAKASQGYFLETDISEADFTEADLTKAVFLKSAMERANLSRCTLRSTIFLTVTGEKVKFAGADMHNTRIINGASLPNGDFTNIEADRACWMKSDLSGSDFRGSRINKGMVEECNLTGANFNGVSAKKTRFNKSDMTGADMQGINIFQGSLRKTRLVNADLRKANLYGAEFYRTGVGKTNFEEANLKMTKLYKKTDFIE